MGTGATTSDGPRRERTREALLAAAAEVFAASGYHAASVDDVAAAAGYTKGAVYSNFATKEALFLSLLDRQVDQAVGVLEQVLREALPEDRSRLLAERHVDIEVLDRTWFLLEAEFLLYAARNPTARAPLAARARRTRERVTQVVARHLADLGVPDEHALATDLARILIATADGLTQAALSDEAAAADAGRLLARTLDALVADARRHGIA